MQSWLDFWNAPNAIYVSRRHQEAHYAKVLSGIRGFVPAGGAAVVLDWGCGDALAANDLAQTCRTLLLYDRADSTRRRLFANYAGSPKIRVLDDAELDAVAPASVDLIVVNSVVQYLDRRQFSDALRLFHRLLKSDGKLLLGDIIAPDTPLVGHVITFLRFAWRNGFSSPRSSGLRAISFRHIASCVAMPVMLVTRQRRCWVCSTITVLSASGSRPISPSASSAPPILRANRAPGVYPRAINPCDDSFRRPAPELAPRRNASTGLMRCAIR